MAQRPASDEADAPIVGRFSRNLLEWNEIYLSLFLWSLVMGLTQDVSWFKTTTCYMNILRQK